MRKFFIPFLVTSLFFTSLACSKKHFTLNATDTEEQAMQKCLRLSGKKHFAEAVECLEIFKSRFPQSNYALEAELKIGDNYFKKKDWLLAAESYALFTRLHPNSDKLDYAYYRAGLAYDKQMPKAIDRDQSYLDKASENLAAVFRNYPDSPYAKMAQAKYDAIRTRLAKKNMYVGNFYFRNGQYIAAIPRYLTVLQDYPELGFDEEALYRMTLAYHRLGETERAQGAAQLMQEKFPQSKKTKSIARKILGGNNG